jgi:hypothetical protein
VRCDFVRGAGTRKIDDIKGASDGEPWSIREMLLLFAQERRTSRSVTNR